MPITVHLRAADGATFDLAVPSPAVRSNVWPDASNTGVPAGTVLRRVGVDVTSGPGWHWDGGWVRVDTDGAVLDALDVPSQIYNPAGHSLTLTRSRVRAVGVGHNTASLALGPGSIVSDCEFGDAAAGFSGGWGFGAAGSGPDSIVVERCNIHHVLHGCHIDGGVTLRDSWIHDLPMGDPVPPDSSTDDHTDGVFISTGWDIRIEGCRFSSANNSGIFVQDYAHTAEGIGRLTINRNRFEAVTRNGQHSAWGVGVENKSIKGAVVVTGNVVDRGPWTAGPVEVPAGAAVSGNVYPDGASADGDVQFKPVIY